jgi:superfamily II DNA helicase RecQ
MGPWFQAEYRNLKNIIKQLGEVPVIGLTATATPKVQEDILKNLENVWCDYFQSIIQQT